MNNKIIIFLLIIGVAIGGFFLYKNKMKKGDEAKKGSEAEKDTPKGGSTAISLKDSAQLGVGRETPQSAKTATSIKDKLIQSINNEKAPSIAKIATNLKKKGVI